MSPSVSNRITVLRPVLILFIIIAHMPGSFYRPDTLSVEPVFLNVLWATLTGTLAMAALPTLSLISGYLAIDTLQKRGAGQFVHNKVTRLFIPMLIWSFPAAILVYMKQKAGYPDRPDLALYPFSVSGWADAITAVRKIPANPPLYFLRELFIACLLLPAYAFLLRYRGLALAILAVMFYLVVTRYNAILLFRLDIYFYFFLGAFASRYQLLAAVDAWLTTYGLTVALGFLAASLMLTYYALASASPGYYLNLLRVLTLLGPLTFWMLSRYLVTSRVYRVLAFLSPVTFTVFLSHAVIIRLATDVWGKLFNAHPANHWTTLYWISAIAIVFVSAWLLKAGYQYVMSRIRSKRAVATSS